jgi:2-oxo-3-hexenedioate decarboxylase
VLHLAIAPRLGTSETDLLSCVDWVAPGFEIVYSIFPDSQFSAADAAAAYGVHGALLIGTKLYLSGEKIEMMKQLSNFSVELESDRGEIRKGRAGNVLGGPLQALKYVVEEIARYPVSRPLLAGELITTGTLTEAMPAVPGAAWTARFSGIDLKPLHLRFY